MKEVPWFPDMKVPKVLLHPPSPQSLFLAKKRLDLAQNWHFWPNIGIFGPFEQMPDQKQCKQVALVVFRYLGFKTFTYSQKN